MERSCDFPSGCGKAVSILACPSQKMALKTVGSNPVRVRVPSPAPAVGRSTSRNSEAPRLSFVTSGWNSGCKMLVEFISILREQTIEGDTPRVQQAAHVVLAETGQLLDRELLDKLWHSA